METKIKPKICSVTPEQQRLMDLEVEIVFQCLTTPFEMDSIETIKSITGSEEVILAPSPKACKDLDIELLKKEGVEEISQAEKQYFSCLLFWLPWAARYAQAKIAGVNFSDMEKYEKFQKFARNVFFCVPRAGWCIVSEKPIEVNWNSARTFLHNETGPSIRWKDGFCMWTINGIRVNEKIVMRPETQTIEEINEEGNNDVKAIRIERYGWNKYLKDSKSELVDTRTHPRELTKESLYVDPFGTMRLIAIDPSTEKPVCLGVPRGTKTCKEAQSWISHGADEISMCRD